MPHFPGGEAEIRDATIALGASDIMRTEGCLDMVQMLGNSIIKPNKIEKLLKETLGNEDEGVRLLEYIIQTE